MTAVIKNRYLEANDRQERVDLRSYARQGIDIVPTVHEGAAVRQMEQRGIQTNKIFSKKTLENVYSWLFIFPYLEEYSEISIDIAEKMLYEKGIEISSDYCAIDEKEIAIINQKCSENMWI